MSPLWQNSGAVFNFATNTWSAISAPTGGATIGGDTTHANDFPYQTAVWTGTEMIAFGGGKTSSSFYGGIFNPDKPAGQQWRTLSTAGAPSGLGLKHHSAVWADDRMLVFGGADTSSGTILSNTLAIFDPATNKWSAGDATGAPLARQYGTTVWTGSALLPFGGYDGRTASGMAQFGSGGIFDVRLNRWTYAYKTEAVQGRQGHTAVWTGAEMIVFGGRPTTLLTATTLMGSAALFNPTTRSWRVLDAQNGPAKRIYHSAVWTGAYMLVTGGMLEGSQVTGNGALFYP
jgi:N-acetylneuraminic acid mutarotase